MDIIVQGEGKKFYKPTEVIISINFYDNEKNYEGAYSEELNNVVAS